MLSGRAFSVQSLTRSGKRHQFHQRHRRHHRRRPCTHLVRPHWQRLCKHTDTDIHTKLLQFLYILLYKRCEWRMRARARRDVHRQPHRSCQTCWRHRGPVIFRPPHAPTTPPVAPTVPPVSAHAGCHCRQALSSPPPPLPPLLPLPLLPRCRRRRCRAPMLRPVTACTSARVEGGSQYVHTTVRA